MPDFTPTVVRPDIPRTDISPLERLLLTTMFGRGSDDEGDLSLDAEIEVDLTPSVSTAELRGALETSRDYTSRVVEVVAVALAGGGSRQRITLDFDLDFGTPLHLVILQDIVRRSRTVPAIVLTTAYPHSGLQFGVGGRATLVTADVIQSRSTDDLVKAFLAHANLAGA